MRVTIHIVSRARVLALRARCPPGAPRAMAADSAMRLSGVGERDMEAAASACERPWPTAPGPSRSSVTSRRASSAHSGCGSTSCACRRPGRGNAVGPTDSPWPRTGSARHDATEADGLAHLVRAYLRAFGPGGVARHRILGRGSRSRPPRRPHAAWSCGPSATRRAVSWSTCPTPRCPTPTRRPRAVPAALGRNLLVHARRTGLLPERYRSRVFSTKNPFSVGTYLVDGVVAGGWSLKDGRIVLDPFEELPAA